MNFVLFLKLNPANIVLCIEQYLVFEHVSLHLCHLPWLVSIQKCGKGH